MNLKFFIFTTAILTCISGAAFAVSVVGGSGHDCFVAAKAGIATPENLAVCDYALNNEGLSIHNRAGTFVNRGVLRSVIGDNEGAMTDYEQALRLQPNLGDAYIDRGAGKIRLKLYEDALTDINKGISLGASYSHLAYYNRAVAEELMGRWTESYYDFKHVLELEPDFAPAANQLKNFIVTKKES